MSNKEVGLSQKILRCSPDKWRWMMDYCKGKGISPSQPGVWEEAENEYYNQDRIKNDQGPDS